MRRGEERRGKERRGEERGTRGVGEGGQRGVSSDKRVGDSWSD